MQNFDSFRKNPDLFLQSEMFIGSSALKHILASKLGEKESYERVKLADPSMALNNGSLTSD